MVEVSVAQSESCSEFCESESSLERAIPSSGRDRSPTEVAVTRFSEQVLHYVILWLVLEALGLFGSERCCCCSNRFVCLCVW